MAPPTRPDVTASPVTTHPATATTSPTITTNLTGRRPFQPGVQIDWGAPAVVVDCRLVFRRGPLEFLACRPGKEHESILRLEGSATHLYLALGLIGLNPGHPPAWDEVRGDFSRPTGDLIDITCEWEEEGRVRTVDAFEWLRGREYGRTPLRRPWVFAGSVRLPDGARASDRSGVAIALVDFSDSLLCLSRGHSSRWEELWVEANTDVLPPLGTPVRLVLRPASPREYQVVLDFRGALFVDGRYATPADVADLLLLARWTRPAFRQVVHVQAALASDVRRVEESLTELGLPADAVRFLPAGDVRSSPPP